MKSSQYIKKFMHSQGGACYYCRGGCKRNPKPGEEHRRATIDHMTPTSRGGTNERTNLCLACADGNTRKANMTVREFLEYLKTGEYSESAPAKKKLLTVEDWLAGK